MKIIVTGILLLFIANVSGQLAGELDPTFNGTGYNLISINLGQDELRDLTVLGDGELICSGYTFSSVTGKDFICLKITPDGGLDPTFGANGVVQVDLNLGSDDVASSVDIQADGKIVLAGYSDDGSGKDAALLRLNADGSVDEEFGDNGIVIVDLDGGLQDEIKTMKIHQLTGKIIVGGSATISSDLAKPFIARFFDDGSLDPDFAEDGVRTLWVNPLDEQYYFSIEDLEVQSNGRISAVGWRDFPGLSWDSDYFAARINSDGSLDNTFSDDGVNTYNGAFNGHDRAFSMVLEQDNGISMFGGGYVSTLYYDFTGFKINADGTVSGWASGQDFGSLANDVIYDAVKTNSNQYVLAGSSIVGSNSVFAINRINSTGLDDINFGTNGTITSQFEGNSLNECSAISLQEDGKIVAVGYSGSDLIVARYLGDAQPELDNFNLLFPINGAVNTNYSNLNMDWFDAFMAAGYEIEYDTNSDFSNPVVVDVSTSSYSATSLEPSTEYFWRVRATDGTNWGEYSEIWSFSTNSLENFSLLAPTNGAVGVDYSEVDFDWTSAIGAQEYEFQLDTSPDFNLNPVSTTETTSDWQATNLLSATTYYWRVRVYGAEQYGDWSFIWSFTTADDPNSLAQLISSPPIGIYPNPACNFITLVCEADRIGAGIEVINNIGETIYSGRCSSSKYILSISDWAPGAYTILIDHKFASTIYVVH